MDLIDKYLGEAKNKPIPKIKGGKGRYHFGIKYDPEGWYQKPEMAGHTYAKETLDAVEKVINTYSKTKLQKWIIETVFDTPQKLKSDPKAFRKWHSFVNHISKKDIANLQYVLRRIDSAKKSGMYALKYAVDRKSSMLKDALTWALEMLSYKYDREVYLDSYIRTYGFYGMEREEAIERFEKYHDGLKKKRVTTAIP